MANTFEYFTGLRGFHVYFNMVNWKPNIEQKILFKHKHNDNYDKFTVAHKTLLKRRIGAVTEEDNEKINGKKHSRNLYLLKLLQHLIKSDLKNMVFNNEQQKLAEGKLM